MSALLDLPHELVLHVLRFLDIPDLAHCLSLCRDLNNLISSTLELQYRLSLSRACLDDGDTGDLPSRSATLQAHQKAWRNLSLSQPSYFPLTDGTWELSGGVLSQNTELSDFVFKFQNLRLPSISRGIQAESWSFVVDIPVIDYTMDVSQDLVVIIAIHRESVPVHLVDQSRYDLHCLTLSTGQPHPSRPSTSPIEYHIMEAGFGGQYRLQIQENLFGLLVMGPAGTEFSVRDWKTSEIKLAITGWPITAFAFITDDLVLLGTGFGLRSTAETFPKLGIVSVSQNTDPDKIYTLSELEHVCILQFPSLLKVDHMAMRFTIRTDPFPSPNGKRQSAPFCTSSRDRLFVVSCGEWTRSWFDAVIPYSRLVRIASMQHPPKRQIPWEEWGPENTRLLDKQFRPSTTWVCYVHGMKMVVKSNDRMALLDFGSPIPEEHTEYHEQGGTLQEIMPLRGPTKFVDDPERRVFKKQIFSSLPCTVSYFDIPDRTDHITAVMLSEDNFIILFRQFNFQKYAIYTL